MGHRKDKLPERHPVHKSSLWSVNCPRKNDGRWCRWRWFLSPPEEHTMVVGTYKFFTHSFYVGFLQSIVFVSLYIYTLYRYLTENDNFGSAAILCRISSISTILTFSEVAFDISPVCTKCYHSDILDKHSFIAIIPRYAQCFSDSQRGFQKEEWGIHTNEIQSRQPHCSPPDVAQHCRYEKYHDCIHMSKCILSADLVLILKDTQDMFDMFIEAVAGGYEPRMEEMYALVRIACKYTMF